MRSTLVEQNLAALVVPKPADYLLGPDDILSVTVRGLAGQTEALPIETQVMADGTITLPLAGSVRVEGMNLAAAQVAIDTAYKSGLLVNPRVTCSLAAKGTMDVTVIGEVNVPGVYGLPRDQNDVAQALGLAGGLTEFAGEVIKIHRRVSADSLPDWLQTHDATESAYIVEQPPFEPTHESAQADSIDVAFDVVIRVPLRGGPPSMVIHDQEYGPDLLATGDLSLRPRDVISVPRKVDPVFFVVGPLSRVNAVNFTVSDRDRQLGNAYLIPEDRDIDVVTAVVMAGYIDPIDSPSTVTLQRNVPGGVPKLIRVDLIKARYSWKENLYVRPGDIIYLNPDSLWWSRRTFDRIVPALLTVPYAEAMGRWINPFANNN